MKRQRADFHARFDAKGKEYRYFLLLISKTRSISTELCLSLPLSFKFRGDGEASKYLLGTHDFTSFCSARTEVEDKVRTLKTIEILRREGRVTVFRFVGNGFLYNMVSILVGTLLEVGQETEIQKIFRDILEKKDRRYAGKQHQVMDYIFGSILLKIK